MIAELNLLFITQKKKFIYFNYFENVTPYTIYVFDDILVKNRFAIIMQNYQTLDNNHSSNN